MHLEMIIPLAWNQHKSVHHCENNHIYLVKKYEHGSNMSSCGSYLIS